MSFPVLATDRLILSDFQPGDESAVFSLFSSDAVIRYYDLSAFTNIKQARDLISFFQSRHEEGAGIRWAVRIKSTNRLIGTCGFNSWSRKMQNTVIGYDLLPNFWGNGYAGEAAAMIVQAAFDSRLPCGPIHRIQADTVPGNLASESLLCKLGFREEGLRRDAGYWKGQYHDLKCYGLLSHEFNA